MRKPDPIPSIAHDIHSYANPEHVQVRHLNPDLKIVFEQQTIQGTAILTVQQHGDGANLFLIRAHCRLTFLYTQSQAILGGAIGRAEGRSRVLRYGENARTSLLAA
jgi:hypothetical protein